MRRRTGITKKEFWVLSSCLIIGIIGLLAFYWWYGLFDLSSETGNADSSDDSLTGGLAVLEPIRTRMFPRSDATIQPTTTTLITSIPENTTELPVSISAAVSPTCAPTDRSPTAIGAQMTLTATIVSPMTTVTSAQLTPTNTNTFTFTPSPTSTKAPTVTLTTAPPPSTSTASRGGSTYHVALSGNDGNPGTQQQPWRSVQKAANTAIAGDTVLVHGGSYKEVVEFPASGIERTGVAGIKLTQGNLATFSGTLKDVLPGDKLYIYHSRYNNNGVYSVIEVGSNYVRVSGSSFVDETQSVEASIATPIKFQVAQSEVVTLDLRYEDNRGSPARFISVNYVILDGFRVTGSQHAGISFDQSNHNVFQNGDIFNNWRPGVYVVNGSKYNMIVGNSIHNNGVNGPGEGVYIGKSPQDGGPDTAHATHIIGNHIYNITEDEGTDVKPGIQGTVITNNVYENCASTWGVVIIGDQSSGSLIYGNILHGNSGSPSWAGAISIHGPNNLIYNNLVFNNSGLDGIYLLKFPGNKIYHNTVYGNDVGIGFDNSGPDLSGTEVSNNLLSQNQSQISGNVGNAVLDCNLFDGASQLLGTNPFQAAPLFVNPAAGDFRLTNASPAINACSDRGIRLDFNRLSRPQGTGFDMGAFEFAP